MDDLPDAAITAAHNAVRELHANVDGGCICEEPWAHLASLKFVAERGLEAAAPALRAQGAATERARLIAVISPERFHTLADWFDTDDKFKETMFPDTWNTGSRGHELQDDLRRFADLLDGDDG